jgi:hypothetical protein
MPAAGGEVTFEPRLASIRVTPAAVTVQAEAQVLVPYALINRQLAALPKQRASRAAAEPLWLTNLRVEQGPRDTLLVRAAYAYEWTRAKIISGGGEGQLAFAGRGELRAGTLRLTKVTLLELDPANAGCFDDRLRRRIEAALQGDELHRLEIKLQAQYDAAVAQLGVQRLTRDGYSVKIQHEAVTALPVFERDGVRLHLTGNLRPRLVLAPLAPHATISPAAPTP